jgi:hypothetical protein
MWSMSMWSAFQCGVFFNVEFFKHGVFQRGDFSMELSVWSFQLNIENSALYIYVQQ